VFSPRQHEMPLNPLVLHWRFVAASCGTRDKTLNARPSATLPTRAWSNRILIAALGGIFFLTLYPFEFSLQTTLPPGRPPFFLGKTNKGGGTLDVLLNICLFLPFGFGLAAKLRRKGRPWLKTLLCTYLAGAFLSYSIEFLQIYIPARDSGWEDVFTNSTGAALGWALFQFAGTCVSHFLSNLEKTIQARLSPRRAFLIAGFVFGAWALYSVHLQKQSDFETWTRDSFLVFSNDATGRRPWKGKLLRVDLWDSALSPDVARALTRDNSQLPNSDAPLVSFSFSSLPPRQQGAQLTIPFAAQVRQPQANESSAQPESMFASSRPVADLVERLQRKSQFSVRVVFLPDEISDLSGRILCLCAPSGIPDLFLGQDGTDLLFWFRNKLTVQRPGVAWTISKLVTPGREIDLLFSYDGSDLRLFSDGRKVQNRYWGPGTALALRFRHAKQGELNGYRDIFYALVFLPIGCLLGLAARSLVFSRFRVCLCFCLGLLFAPIFLEVELALLNGRAFSPTNFLLSVGMLLAGVSWISADPVIQ